MLERLAVVALIAGFVLGCGGSDEASGASVAAGSGGSTSSSSVATGTGGAGGSGGAGGTEDMSCAKGDVALAPPAMDVDGLHAVPIDIESVDAKAVFDATAQAATADATMKFTMGPSTGYPIFDLRQTILKATLNGKDIDPKKIAHHSFGGGADADMLVIEEMLPSCSKNDLVLHYDIAQPSSPASRPIGWDPMTSPALWDFWFTDLKPGRYLEMWFPANLIYDRFAFTLDLELKGATEPHTLVTNATVDTLSATHWQLSYPPTSTALSTLLVLVPDSKVDKATFPIDQNGMMAPVELDLYADKSLMADLPGTAANVKKYMDEFTASTGKYPWSDRLTVYLWTEATRSMEYDGGTTTNITSLKHELFHSWFGRGVKPARQNDGWFDESWDVYNTDAALAFESKPLDFNGSSVLLSSSNLWTRTTPSAAYTSGEKLFAGLSVIIGLDTMKTAMSQFYSAHVFGLLTTQDVEHTLYCASKKNPQVTQAFYQFVYGQKGMAPPDVSTCP